MTAPSPVEGQIELAVTWDGSAVTQASVFSNRPRLTPMFRDLPVADVVQRIPLLFSLCGEAQAVAANALQQLLQEGQIAEDTVAEFAGRIRLEIVREHLWRLALDWMPLVGLEPVMSELRQLMTGKERFLADPGELQAWGIGVQEAFFGGQTGVILPSAIADGKGPVRFLDPVWLQSSSASLAELARRLDPELRGLGLAPIRPASTLDLPMFLATVEAEMMRDPDFAAYPHWFGEPLEMGPLARMCAAFGASGESTGGRFVVDAFSRFSARVAELFMLLADMVQGKMEPLAIAWSRGEHSAVVALEMARGILVHRVEVLHGKVVTYGIVAPTEWNFHPRGSLQAGLLRSQLPVSSSSVLERAIRQQVMALDPCVRYSLEIRHA
jgi:hypothetical protein